MSATSDRKYLSCAETAKLLRKALKAEFPGQKFSVRSHTYAGGASIDVRWADGPTQRAVQNVCDLYSGGSFDGMTDMMSYHDSLLMGEDGPQVVSFGADFIFAERSFSAETVAGVAVLISQLSGEPCDLSSRPGDWNRAYPLCVVSSDTESGLNVMCLYRGETYAQDLVHRWLQDKDFRS